MVELQFLRPGFKRLQYLSCNALAPEFGRYKHAFHLCGMVAKGFYGAAPDGLAVQRCHHHVFDGVGFVELGVKSMVVAVSHLQFFVEFDDQRGKVRIFRSSTEE